MNIDQCFDKQSTRIDNFSLSSQIVKLQSFLKVFSIFFTLFMLSFLMGCGPLVQNANQKLEVELPEYFFVEASPEKVWKVVADEAILPPDCILSKDPKHRIISWCEPVEDWRDLGQDTVGPPGTVFDSFAKKPGKGTAVTTISIKKMGSGSRIYVRKTYFGTESFTVLGDSRGDSERKIHQKILSLLKTK